MDGYDTKHQGQGDEVKGRVQEAWGALTGDEDRKAEGEAKQDEGKGKQVLGDLQQTVEDATK